MFRKLLIPTDGSDLASKAVAFGIGLAKETGASVMLVTVTDMWSPWQMPAAARINTANPVGAYEDAAHKAAVKVLDAARKLADDAGVPVETTHVADRHTAEGIVETADKVGADLIVMATHGRRGIGQLLVGSETTEVLHVAKVPVLVVR